MTHNSHISQSLGDLVGDVEHLVDEVETVLEEVDKLPIGVVRSRTVLRAYLRVGRKMLLAFRDHIVEAQDIL